MKYFKVIIVGGGFAGLHLAYCLSSAFDWEIAIIDPDFKNSSERIFSFWSLEEPIFKSVVQKSWQKIMVADEHTTKTFSIHPYVFYSARYSDIRTFFIKRLKQFKNITFIQGKAFIQTNAHQSSVVVDNTHYHAQWIFDSSYTDLQTDLYMHSLEEEIYCPHGSIDDSTMTFLDFRTEKSRLGFYYVLPTSPTHCTVQYTIITQQKNIQKKDFESGINNYLNNVFHMKSSIKNRSHFGTIPLSKNSQSRKPAWGMMTIGRRAGLVSSVSGFGLTAILKDSDAIVESLQNNNHPYGTNNFSPFYSCADWIMLRIYKKNPSVVKKLFTTMFATEEASVLMFNFLDKSASIWENYQTFNNQWFQILRNGLTTKNL